MARKKQNNIIGEFIQPFQRFFQIEAASGIVLLIATAAALYWANSPWSSTYHDFWESHFSFKLGNFFEMDNSLLHWINDGLMAIFFFVVGLEIKRELLAGELSSIKKASLPIAAALGGMLIPAIFYILLNTNPITEVGWGIPMATDIAFSIGVLSLLGRRVPIALKVFLVAFAIVDDLGAVLIIAIFYSQEILWYYLLIAIILLLVLAIFNRLNIKWIPPYMVLGWIIWYLFYKAGIHPTIAGVLIAFTIPVKRSARLLTFKINMQNNLDYFCAHPNNKNAITLTNNQLAAIDNMEEEILDVQSPVQRLEHTLHTFVTFIVMPLFALANAGVVLHGIDVSGLFLGLSGVIQFSLIFGKLSGIFIFSWLAVKIGVASLPEGVVWKQIIGLALLGGMGFTMSLFISNLAFTTIDILNPAKIGILAGSLIAGISGYIILKISLKNNTN